LEFLFRGIIQNLFHSRYDSKASAARFLLDYDESMDNAQYYERMDYHEENINQNSKPINKTSGRSTDEFNDVLIMKSNEQITGEKSYLPPSRDSCAYGLFWWFLFPNYRDYLCLFAASLLYVIASIKWRTHSTTHILGGFISILWLGCCLGWLWRHTNSVFVSALLQVLIIFCSRYVFANNSLCANACGRY